MKQPIILLAFERSKALSSVQTLFDSISGRYRILESQDFSDAATMLRREAFDCCLAYGSSRDAVMNLHKQRQATPIIWILEDSCATQIEADKDIPDALDLWLSSELSAALITHCVPLLLERHMLQQKATHPLPLSEQHDVDKEIATLLNWYYRTTVTAEILGSQGLKELLPKRFADFAQRFGDLIDQALEEQMFKVAHKSSSLLHDLSQQLSLLNAGPRDIIEIYAHALRARTNGGTDAKSRAYIECSRIVLLEMMGYMVTHYRNLSRLATRSNPPRRHSNN